MQKSSFSQLKSDARASLSKYWGTAVGITLIPIVISIGISMTLSFLPYPLSSLASILSSFVSIIISVGVSYFYLKLCSGYAPDASINDIGYALNGGKLGKTVLLYLLTLAYLLIPTIVYIIGVAIALALYNLNTFPSSSTVVLLSLFIAILSIAFIVAAMFISLTYQLVYYVMVDFPELDTWSTWKKCAAIMKGNRLRLWGLQLSFIPWALLALLTCGIGYIFLTPYMNATFTCFYLDIAKGYQETPVLNQNYTPARTSQLSSPNIETESTIEKEDPFADFNSDDKFNSFFDEK